MNKMMLLIRDKTSDAQRFPLVKFLESLYHNFNIQLESNLSIRKAWGYGEQICELEEKLENVECLSVTAEYLLNLAKDKEQWFYDFESQLPSSDITFGLIDSGALFCTCEDDMLLEKIASRFQEVEITSATK